MSDGAFCHYCKRAGCECPEPAIVDKGMCHFCQKQDCECDRFYVDGQYPSVTPLNSGTSVTLQSGDVVQAMIEEIKKLTVENAAMKAVLQSRGFTVVNGQWFKTEETV